jgi:hypothetical protein
MYPRKGPVTHKGSLNSAAEYVRSVNERWWKDPVTGEPIDRNVGQMLMLTVSELSEAMEGDRKDLQDDHLPQYAMFDVELVDAAIRIFDILANRGADIDEIFFDKMLYNIRREDHKHENRIKPGGKAY